MNVFSILQSGLNLQALEVAAGALMLGLARFRLGRILLHLIAMLGDRCGRFHALGIMRELCSYGPAPSRIDRACACAIWAFLLAARIWSGIH
jgi:hypothetical protein